jgi:serine/threonine protein kinase
LGGLLRSSLEFLGYKEVIVPGWKLGRFLGRGGSSIVFSARQATTQDSTDITTRDYPFVLKMYEYEKFGSRDNEVAKLSTLKDVCVTNIPVVVSVAESPEYLALVVAPVGQPIQPSRGATLTLRGKHFSDLVTVLEHAHRLGIIHRDVKPDNIFIHNGNVILNDWGSACDAGVPTAWVGTRCYSEPPPLITAVLDSAAESDSKESIDCLAAGEHCPRPSDDLKALVRTAYSCLLRDNLLPPFDDTTEITSYWNARSSPPHYFHELLEYALSCDYDNLRLGFERL